MTAATMDPRTRGAAMDPRTRVMLEGPIAPTLLRLGLPNVLLMMAQAASGLIETWFVGRLGTDALAGMALVFPTVMLMQMMSGGAMVTPNRCASWRKILSRSVLPISRVIEAARNSTG